MILIALCTYFGKGGGVHKYFITIHLNSDLLVHKYLLKFVSVYTVYIRSILTLKLYILDMEGSILIVVYIFCAPTYVPDIIIICTP